MTRLLIFVTTLILVSSLSAKEYSDKEIDKLVNSKVEERLGTEIKRIKKHSVAELTNAVIKREKELESERQDFEADKLKLINSTKEFEQKILDFDLRQNKFIACIAEDNAMKEKRIKKMVEVIAGMKPQKAAELISVQDQGIAVMILSKLDTTKSSKIFNLLDKEKSAELQKIYLNMKK